MAAVDRRMGMIRRGSTPAAPKPINLPSQKLENQGLVPDVEIVPRGTFCWGRAGRSSAASGKNSERTNSAPLHSESSGTVDNGMDVLVSLDDAQGLTERSNPPHPVDSSTLPTSSPSCITSVETTSASSSFQAENAKPDRSLAASDVGTVPGSVAQVSSSESCTSDLVTPVTFNKTRDSAAKVEEQKHSKGLPLGGEGFENVSNLESKQGTLDGDKTLPGCQDFGYFEGFYSNHHAFFSPGMSYPSGPRMAFGSGLLLEPSQHDGFYSLLGVPYYDSTKDKEIVVITMVGNPGLHGNYLPHPSLPNQYGGPTACGNFPLQFGHFDHFAVPGQNILHGMQHMSAEMNSMCSGDHGEFVYYEQEYCKNAWLKGSSIDDVQRGNGAFLPTSFSICKNSPNLRNYSIPKRAGRQKSAYRNKRAAPEAPALSAASKPERRVTLLTKVSQHEVIISNLQQGSKLIENGLGGDFSVAPSISENFMEAPSCDPQCETAGAESPNADRDDEIVDIEKSCVSDAPRSLSAQQVIPQQAMCTGSNNVDSALLSCHDESCLKKAEISASESSSKTISTVAPYAHGELVDYHENIVATSCRGEACQVPDAPSTKIPEVIGRKQSPKHAPLNVNNYMMNAAELPLDASLNGSTMSSVLIKQVNMNREETPCTTSVTLLPYEHSQRSTSRLPNQKGNTKWRRKEAVTSGQERLISEGQGAVVDKKTSPCPLPCDKAVASAISLPNATVGTKVMAQSDTSLSSGVPAAPSASETSAASKEESDAAGFLNCAVSDSALKIKKSRKVNKAVSENVDLDSVAVQISKSFNKLAIKTVPLAEGRSLNWKTASCGFGKEWRPKLCGAGHGKTAKKASSHQCSKATLTSRSSKLQENKPYLVGIHGDPKHSLEVSCDDECVDKLKQQLQDEGCYTNLPLVNIQQTAKVRPSTCITGSHFNNVAADKEQKEESNSSAPLPSRYSRVEQGRSAQKLTGEQKPLQQELLASELEELNHSCRWDMPMNNHSFEAYQGSQPISSLPTQENFREVEDVSQPMLATQTRQLKVVTKDVNQFSKAALRLRQESPLKNYQEKIQLPVKKVTLRHAEPAHIMHKNQHAEWMAGWLPNFGRDSMKQGHYVASWKGRQIGSPLDVFRHDKFDQNHGHPLENWKGQSLRSRQQQKVWSRKVMHAQEQQMAATTCSSVSEPCEGFSDGDPGAENKKHASLLQSGSRVSWKPKKMTSLHDSKEKCKEGVKDNPSSSVSQKKRAPGECLLIEYSGNTSSSFPCENEQQLNKHASCKLKLQMKQTSEVCTVASCSSAPSFLSCGSGQQVDSMGNQGLTEPASQSGKAFEEFLVAIPSSSCGKDIDKKESLNQELQMKMGFEECPVVTSSSCAMTSSPCGNWQQSGDTGKQSHKATLEMERSAVTKNVSSSMEQIPFGPISQHVSVVAISSKLEDTLPTRSVKAHNNHMCWRPKSVSGSRTVKSAVSKGVNENDPLASTHVEVAPKKHAKPLPASTFAAANDLHVWKNNGKHPVRASYGFPYQLKDYAQLPKPLDGKAKFHTDGSTSLELPDRANTSFLNGESPRASKSLVIKQIKSYSFQEHPVSKLKSSQHHVYGVENAHFISNQRSTVGNRRPFSTKSNFSHDDNKKIAQYQQPVSHLWLRMEQGYCRPFLGKSNFSYDDNKRAFKHQQFLSHISKCTERVKVGKNYSAQGSGHVESLSPQGSDIKPARHGQLCNGQKFAYSEKRGWVVKTEARCGEH